METIKIQVEDRIARSVGLKTIKERMQKEIEFIYYEELAENIKHKLDASEIDNDDELEKARWEAWNEKKSEYLKGIINE